RHRHRARDRRVRLDGDAAGGAVGVPDGPGRCGIWRRRLRPAAGAGARGRRVAGGEPLERRRRIDARADARLLRSGPAGYRTRRGAAPGEAALVAAAGLCASVLLGCFHPGRRLAPAGQDCVFTTRGTAMMRAFHAVTVIVILAACTPHSSAQPPKSQTVLDEAERLDQQAATLDGKGQYRAAI